MGSGEGGSPVAPGWIGDGDPGFLVEVAQVDPTIIQLGGDILLNNIAAPGMSQMAERKRQQLLNQGVIPFEQMTDEEQQQAQQAAQQPPPEDPMMVAAQAEMTKATNEQAVIQLDGQVKSEELRQSQQTLDQNQQKIDQEGMKIQANIQMQTEADAFKAGKTMSEVGLNTDKMESEITKNYVESLTKLMAAGDANPMATMAGIEASFIDAEVESRVKGMPTNQLIELMQ